MASKILGLLAFGLLASAAGAQAATITFTATGSPDVSGFIQFDDSAFNGSSFQAVSNSYITGLSLTVLGDFWSLAQVDTLSSTIIDSSGATPVLKNGSGTLAATLSAALYFSNGLDGDAAIQSCTAGAACLRADPLWVTSSVPEPGTLVLLSLGLLGLGVAARRRPH